MFIMLLFVNYGVPVRKHSILYMLLFVKSDSFKVLAKKYDHKIGNKANICFKFCTYYSLIKPEIL